MRLVIARCQVDYSGRLSAHLPMAKRLIIVKSDGSVSVHADDRAYKPLNWMSAPCALQVLEPDEVVATELGAQELWEVTSREGDRLRIHIGEVYLDSDHLFDPDPGLQKDGVEAHLQVLLAENPGSFGDGWKLVQREYYTPIGPVDISDIQGTLPDDLDPLRESIVLTAYQLLGKVTYFWGGKSLVLGWDSRWGTPTTVTAPGSGSTGKVLPFGLDCSGFVDWTFYNATNGAYLPGRGGGAASQHGYCTNIAWSDALPGDLVFYADDSHVGIVCGYDSVGNILVIHCSGGQNGVVVTGREGFAVAARPDLFTD